MTKKQTQTREGILPVWMKAGYGAGDLGGNLFFTVVAFWLTNYLTDEVKLSGTMAGLAILLGKLWDAVTDPAVGLLSDRTRTRWGRRRPWFLFAAVPLGFAMLFMFTNPGFESAMALFFWASGAYMLLCTVYTCVNIPYNALTPELTADFDERTSLNGYRMIFAVIGTLIGAGTALPIISAFEDRTQGFMAMGAIFGTLMALSSLVPFFFVREPVRAEAPKDKSMFMYLVHAYRDAFRNKPFLLILFPWAFNIVGFTVVTATLIYYFKYIYRDEASLTIALVVMLLTSMVFIPLSVLLSKRIGKKIVYLSGMSLLAASVLVFFAVGHKYGLNFAYIIMFTAGIGLSTHYVMPWAIVPDTVEYDYAKSGVRREGIYYGLWTFMIKLGQAVAGLLVGVILDAFGYIPEVEQSESALLGIRLLVGPFTAMFFVAANVILAFYPIDKQAYEEIQATIKRREAAGEISRG
ncbi:MAG: MFS transporter [Spirochaetales bacterium]|nr:MFS transporter [Leptospiraceae bacterium]MCP5481501.1 MFS transporter [Spirochaetales bacterium]MCP5484330.1 MFS transporter [Spirochaetales bacterium]